MKNRRVQLNSALEDEIEIQIVWAASESGIIGSHFAPMERGAGWARGVPLKRSSGRQDPMFIGVLAVRSAVRHPSGRRQRRCRFRVRRGFRNVRTDNWSRNNVTMPENIEDY